MSILILREDSTNQASTSKCDEEASFFNGNEKLPSCEVAFYLYKTVFIIFLTHVYFFSTYNKYLFRNFISNMSYLVVQDYK